jgi:hypothetical protein
LISNFPLDYNISEAQENKEDLKLNGIHQPLVCADEDNLLAATVNIFKKTM